MKLRCLSTLALSLMTGFANAATTPVLFNPDPKWLADVATLTTQAAQTAPDLEKLIKESQTQSNTTSLQAFLATVKICDGEGQQAARVNQTSNQRYFFIPRDLDEKPDSTQDELITFYSSKIQKDLPNGMATPSLNWHFGPDSIIAHTVETNRVICIRQGLTPDQGVEILAHEMVHYTRSGSLATVDLALKAKNARDYAEQTVIEPGDEVDAYIEEDSLRIRRHGDKFYYANPRLAAFFNDYGTFVSTREKMATHILDDMYYMLNRFNSEYKSMLQNQLSYETQLESFNEGLLKIREQDVESLTTFMKGRLKVLNSLWPTYDIETKKGRKLLDGSIESQKRLSAEIPKEKERISLLQARLKTH